MPPTNLPIKPLKGNISDYRVHSGNWGNYKEEEKTGVTLRIMAYIVYSKSAGDNRD